jgi:hypothetical protein
MCTNITVQAELSECVQLSCPFKDQAGVYLRNAIAF